ncbi:hypothetical protein BJY00DRAFT_320007 [Aspergillus carlsbadensis]|nr:hypothetical protein BJY00DRAFT_320007 [Aspergillus carlsbadensis]
MICWEADRSPGDWGDKLDSARKHLARLAKELSIKVGNDALSELIGQLPGFSEYADMVFWIENIAIVIQGLLNLFTNHDDKVKENNYGFSRESLSWWSDRDDGYIGFSFDGGSQGDHGVSVRPYVGMWPKGSTVKGQEPFADPRLTG